MSNMLTQLLSAFSKVFVRYGRKEDIVNAIKHEWDRRKINVPMVAEKYVHGESQFLVRFFFFETQTNKERDRYTRTRVSLRRMFSVSKHMINK